MIMSDEFIPSLQGLPGSMLLRQASAYLILPSYEMPSSIVYSIDVKNILKLLWDNQLAAMQDPAGISGYIYPCSTEAKKTDALSKLSTALVRAQKAREAESSEKIKDAFDCWDLLYDNKFRSYY